MNGEEDKFRNVAVSAGDLLKLELLNRRNACIEAARRYLSMSGKGVSPSASDFCAEVACLYLDLYTHLEAMYSKEDDSFKRLVGGVSSIELYQLANGTTYDEARAAFLYLDRYLYHKNVIRFDLRENYKRQNVEVANRARGLS